MHFCNLKIQEQIIDGESVPRNSKNMKCSVEVFQEKFYVKILITMLCQNYY